MTICSSCIDRSNFHADLNLYFFNSDKTSIIRESRSIQYDETEEIIPNIIKELSKKSSQNDNVCVINKHVKINEIIPQSHDKVIIDLNSEFLSDNINENLLATYAVVKSVCSANAITGINYLKITVDGNDIITEDGKSIDFLTYNDIQLSEDNETKSQINATLYIPKKDYLKKEIRSIWISDSEHYEKHILTELFQNNSIGELISAETIDSICFVNLKLSFTEKNVLDNSNTLLSIYSVVNSLTELEHIDGVQFLIDGKKTKTLGNVNIENVLQFNESLIK